MLSPLRLAKIATFLACLVPAGTLVYRAFVTGDLGVNPIETLTHETGQWSLRLLLVTLAVTPLRRITGWNRAISFRRMLGLFAFFYAVLHVSVWMVFDHSFTLRTMIEDVLKRPYITAGFVAVVTMVPLALTSTGWAIRRLGKRWQALHRLIYLSAAAAVIHFIWKEKVIINETLMYAAILVMLFAIRVVFAWRQRAARTQARHA